MLRRKHQELSEAAVGDYAAFRHSLADLTDTDRQALAARFAKRTTREWYTILIAKVFTTAYDSGRLIRRQELVADARDEIAALAGIAEVAGGAAIDIAVAVLVRDLLDPEDYRKVTTWWTRTATSAWLPGTDDDPAVQNLPRTTPAAEPKPALENTQQMPPAGRPTAAGAARVRSDTAPRVLPTAPDPQQVRLELAADVRRRKAARHRRITRLRWTASAYGALSVFILWLAADAFGGQLMPFGSWLGRDRATTILLILALAAAVKGAVHLRRINAARKERY